MKKVTKKQLIEACETILQEYKEDRHYSSLFQCSLCRLFYNPGSCGDCPSSIFGRLGCEGRLCKTYYSNVVTDTQKFRLIEYWTLTIRWMKKQKADDLRKRETYEILKEFDQQAYDKFQ